MSNWEDWVQPEEETEQQILVEWEEWVSWERLILESQDNLSQPKIEDHMCHYSQHEYPLTN